MSRGSTRDAPSPRLLRRPASVAGVVGAMVFLAAAFAPSLLPRAAPVQGVVSGVALAIGYGIGSAVSTALRWREGTPLGRRRGFTLGLVGLVVIGPALVLHWDWQHDVRRLMGVEGAVPAYLAMSLTVALLVSYLLLVVARSIRGVTGWYRRLLERLMPGWAALMLTLATLAASLVVFVDVVILDRAIGALDRAYLEASLRMEPGVEPPSSGFRAGGPGSLIPWEDLGSQGRAFVSEGPDRSQVEEFHGTGGRDPIRVYAGLQVADTAQGRVERAMMELERLDAFDREVILVLVPTGTGWVDPYAVDALEYMHNGDVATVAVQYSHRPSWLVMIGNQEVAVEVSHLLFEGVRRRSEDQPAGNRPRLLLYGQSLGAFGLQSLFDDVEEIREQTDGVLWVGPPRSSPLWKRLVAGRDPESPVWRPVYDSGVTVRFGHDLDSLSLPQPWPPPRVVYLQNSSDPITWLSLDMVYRRPEWLQPPRGPDVSAHLVYLPVVTFWQVVVDLVVGTNAPEGHGHKFGSAQTEAWSLIAPPQEWTESDTARLLDVTAP